MTANNQTLAELRRQGYVVQADFFSPTQCQEALALIGAYRQNHTLPQVYRRVRGRSLRYSVIDGEQIEQHLPSIWQLYQEIGQLASHWSGVPLVPLPNKKVSVNINVVSSGGAYRWHYDRNALTVILYLNQVPGGETEIYPNYRLYLARYKATVWQRALDHLLQLSLVRKLFGQKVSVKPQPGTLVIMQGDKCLHSVRPVEGDQDRINIILAYDRPGANFPAEESLDRYLFSQEQLASTDPNYV